MFSIQGYLYQASVKMGLDSESILGKSEYEDSGGHRPQGIIVLSGPDIRPGERIADANVADILPTMLALSRLPVPEDLDGQPLTQAFSDILKDNIQFVSPKISDARQASSPELDGDELNELEDRLRSLGYLG